MGSSRNRPGKRERGNGGDSGTRKPGFNIFLESTHDHCPQVYNHQRST